MAVLDDQMLPQQPLSMMAINADPTKKDDLLIVRMLESSKRKMQMVKSLIEPEKYDSIAFSSLTSYYKDTENIDSPDVGYSDEPHDQSFDEQNNEKNERLNATPSMETFLRSTKTLEETLSKKREGVNFFLHEANEPKNLRQANLAIELRSGYYLSRSKEGVPKILNESKFNLRDFIMRYLSILGIALDNSPSDAIDIQQEEFEDRFKDIGQRPFKRKQNLRAMGRRLKALGELERVNCSRDSLKIFEPKELDSKSYSGIMNLDQTRFSNNFVPAMKHNAVSVSLSHPFKFNSFDRHSLIYNPIVERFHRIVHHRQNLSEYSERLKKVNGISFMAIDPSRLLIKRHKLMLVEEKLSFRMIEIKSEIERLYESIRDSEIELLSMKNKVVDRNNTRARKGYFNRICDILGLRNLSIDKLKVLVLEARALFFEIETVRKEQQFNSTSVTICDRVGKQTSGQNEKGSLEELVKQIQSLNRSHDWGSEERRSFMEKMLDEFDYISIKDCEVNEEGLAITPDNECPLPERRRRSEIKRWMNGLRLKFLIGDEHLYECFHDSEIFRLDLGKSQTLSVPLLKGDSISFVAELHYIIIDRMPAITIPIAKTQSIKIPIDGPQEQILLLEPTYFGQVEAQLHLVFRTPQISNSQDTNREATINKLFRYYFDVPHRFDDMGTKINRLMNQIDQRKLARMLGVKSLVAKCVMLYPYEAMFDDHPDQLNTCSAFRASLLMRRWFSNKNQIVYLSERENKKMQGFFGIDELKNRLKLVPVKNDPNDYRSIKRLRAWASDYIKAHECELIKTLNFKNEKGEQTDMICLYDVLAEPIIEMNFDGFIESIRKMAPKPKVRRPLLPQRKSSKSATMLSHHELWSSYPNLENDLETQQLDAGMQRMQNLMNSMISLDPIAGAKNRNFQVVITVQQAYNVPMRIIAQPNPLSRPTSPFGFAISGSPTSFLPSISYSLVPPTTYVEVTFQRRHQATSLSVGKHPAWNDTLFIPINLGTTSASSSTSDMFRLQLVDDFLQLNLYDYCCYQLDRHEFQSSLHDSSTQALIEVSKVSDQIHLGSQPRHLASHQQVERHLLGSLRIPLSTLMSTGKIEGSFELTQPLILDNYQFEPDSTLVNHNAHEHQLVMDHIFKRNIIDKTHINLFITIDPPITIPTQLYLPTGSHETDAVFEYACLWEQVVSKHSRRFANILQNKTLLPNNLAKLNHNRRRYVRTLVLSNDAKYSLTSRLLLPLEPPRCLLESKDVNHHMKASARFVSLLSPLKHGLFRVRTLAPSLWFNSLQLINNSLGGAEEKAVLLCNYFLYIGKCSALLLGDSIQKGQCIYVITWFEQSNLIEDQLQLHATSLLQSINGTIGQKSTKERKEVIDRHNFLARLPINGSNSVQLWDPMTADCYWLKDQIPLVSIGSIVTVENVYANIQPVEFPANLNFDIRHKHFWLPLFESFGSNSGNSTAFNIKAFEGQRGKHMTWRRQRIKLDQMKKAIGHPSMTALTNPLYEEFHYDRLAGHQCDELKLLIEQAVKSQLLKWRPDRPTYFNRALSRQLSKKLTLFEDLMVTSGDPRKPDWKSELAEMIKSEVLGPHLSSGGLNTRQVVSCPINMPFTDIKTILDTIFASGVQNADLALESPRLQSAANSQFILACHLHPYPACIVSVWLYIGAVVPTVSKRLLEP